MGRSYLFECTKCGYKAHVSGGADRGFHVSVQTICCGDCKRLYDAVVRAKMPVEPPVKQLFGLPRFPLFRARSSNETPPRFETVANRLPSAVVRHAKWVHFKIRCPVSAFHRVHIWSEPGKCPRCASFLEKNAIPFRIWD